MTTKLIDKIGAFTAVPNALLKNTSLHHQARWLFVVLRTYASNKDVLFPSLDALEELSGMTRKAIVKRLRELETAGWLERQRRFSGSTVYTLKYPSAISSESTLMSADNESPISGESTLPLVANRHCISVDSHPLTRLSEQDKKKKKSARAQNACEHSAIVATIPPTADVANSVTMESPAHLRTMPPPNHKRPAWMGPTERDKRLTTYEALTGWKLNKLQEDDICQRVRPDDPAWEECIRKRMSFGCSIRRASSAVDDYLAGGPVDFKAQRDSQRQNVAALVNDIPQAIEWVLTPKGKVLRYEGQPYAGDAGRQKCAELGITYEGN